MTLPFANILCRPGPSAISPLGPDLYAALPNPTTNTFLDAFQPRPEDGTILGPHLIESPEGMSLQVERFDHDHAGNIAETAKAILRDAYKLKNEIEHTTQGRWRIDDVEDWIAHFDGPSKRFVKLRNEENLLHITIGSEGEISGARQEVTFRSSSQTEPERSRTESYEFWFKEAALEGLKALLGLPSGGFEFIDGGLSLIGNEDFLAVALRPHTYLSDRSRFMPLKPILRKLLWDSAMAFLR